MIWKWLKKNIDIKGYDITAFLCHQAVEKLLKCIFVLDIREIPRSHHIDELAKDLNLEANIIDLIKDLTYDYTFSRYPDVSHTVPFEEYTEDIAMTKLNATKTIFRLLKNRYEALLEEK